MNILILGNGFVGSRLYGYLKSSSQIDRVVVLAKSDIDYTDPRLIYDYISNNTTIFGGSTFRRTTFRRTTYGRTHL